MSLTLCSLRDYLILFWRLSSLVLIILSRTMSGYLTRIYKPRSGLFNSFTWVVSTISDLLLPFLYARTRDSATLDVETRGDRPFLHSFHSPSCARSTCLPVQWSFLIIFWYRLSCSFARLFFFFFLKRLIPTTHQQHGIATTKTN